MMATSLAGLLLPLLLLPLIKFTGYSELLEEFAKTLIIAWLIIPLPGLQRRLLITLLFGLLFSLSESFFYLNNLFQLGNLSPFISRLVYTLPLHLITSLLILSSGLAGRKFMVFGLVAALALHLIFNYYALIG